jgi:uncharacterized protein YutE (UPF0331/DUF86 family)
LTLVDTLLAKSYGFKDLEYKKIAIELGEKGIVEKEYASVLMKMAGYRNRMANLYHEVGSEEIYDILKNHLFDIEQFVGKMASFIETYKKSVNDTKSTRSYRTIHPINEKDQIDPKTQRLRDLMTQ